MFFSHRYFQYIVSLFLFLFFCRWSFISDHFPTVFVAICFEAPGPGFLIDLKGADSGYVRRSSVRGSIHWHFRKSRLCSFTRELSALTSLFARLPKNLLKMHNDSIDDDRTQGIKTMIRIMEKSSGSYFFGKERGVEWLPPSQKACLLHRLLSGSGTQTNVELGVLFATLFPTFFFNALRWPHGLYSLERDQA